MGFFDKAKEVMFATHCVQEIHDITRVPKARAEKFALAFNAFLQQGRLAKTPMPTVVAELCLNVLESRYEVQANFGDAANDYLEIAALYAKHIVQQAPDSGPGKAFQAALQAAGKA